MGEIDPNKPSIARIYDYWLGGKDNYAADRRVGQRMMRFAPEMPVAVRENKQMLTRAVDWSARQGITQFIDMGCGLPTSPGTHETARQVAPEAKVAYVDNDPVVINHLTVLLPKDPAIAVVDGDIFDFAAILAEVGKLIDPVQPACLLMGALVHFFERYVARDLVARYVSALAPGSYVVLTAGWMPPGPDAERASSVYSSGGRRGYAHSPEDLVSFLDGLEIVPPGVADTRVWRPGQKATDTPAKRTIWINGVMARVP